jgi:uncharacterized protein YpuA (DUF1002 family)
LPYVPFNEELNRYRLVVENLSTATADVTWGKSTKMFTRTELETGINLADEFMNNPFSASFAALDRVVATKQIRETNTIKRTITNFRALLNDFPEDEELANALNVIRTKLFEQNALDAAKARAAVKPVTHTIKITPKI